ncbi:dTMP kinase [Canibacter sp. lx-72]|uniref:dTMP kinase n=1 Tax=Canibacter zhuwentaonis TaxID=2837491 RepID=UPI001BDC4DF6|nr:dTMP kinase [Canibacter zhuwentaonis]MBT1018524.1 dTMP kinase [Canibacter zhuwentaonis]MBT1035719.1 dTMP kinase [Canibacter zhuwentaonis]
MRSHSGLFVVFEGCDGAGKSTQLRLLANSLREQLPQQQIVCTREPGGTLLGSRIRELLLHGSDVAPRAEALLYAADRAQHYAEVIMPALAAGSIVLQDRYIDSSIAYQAGARGLSEEWIYELSAAVTEGTTPDLTVLLDFDPALRGERIAHREEAEDRIECETLAFHTSVAETFRRLATKAPERYLLVDATAPIAEINRLVVAKVNDILATS